MLKYLINRNNGRCYSFNTRIFCNEKDKRDAVAKVVNSLNLLVFFYAPVRVQFVGHKNLKSRALSFHHLKLNPDS